MYENDLQASDVHRAREKRGQHPTRLRVSVPWRDTRPLERPWGPVRYLLRPPKP
jgi:hypothetical protein